MPLAATIDDHATPAHSAYEAKAPDQAMRSHEYGRQKDVKTNR